MTANRWLLWIVAFALAVRLIYLLLAGGLDDILHDSMTDQYLYVDLGRSLVEGRGYSLTFTMWMTDRGEPTSLLPPLYPVFLALSFGVFGPSLIPIRLMQTALSVVVVAIAALLGDRLFGRRTGILAGILAALYPPLVMYVRPIMSEGLFYPLVALLMWATYRLDQEPGRTRLYAAWAIIAAMAILTRSEVVLLVGMLLAYLALRRRPVERPARAGSFALLLAVMAAGLLPYAAYNRSIGGSFLPLPNAKWKFWDHTWWAEMRARPQWAGVDFPERIIVPNWSDLGEIERDTYLWNLAWAWVRENPGLFLEQRIRRVMWAYPVIPVELFRPAHDTSNSSISPEGLEYGPTALADVITFANLQEVIRVWAFRTAFALAVGGIVLMLKRRQSQAYWLLLVVVWNVAHTTAFVGSERMRLQIDPYLILFAAACLDALAARWGHRAAPVMATRVTP